MSDGKTNVSASAAGMPMEAGDREKVTSGLEYVLDVTMGKRIAFLRDEVGSDKFVRVVGRSEKQIKRYENGDDVPFSVLERVAEEFGVSLSWLAYGQATGDADVVFEKGLISREIEGHKAVLAKRNLSEVDKLISEFALDHWEFVLAEHKDDEIRRQRKRPAVEAEFVQLPVYSEIRASAGTGAAVPGIEQADGVVAFSMPFLRDQGANPERCSIIWARGDSMLPTIPDGSILVVDCSQTDVVNGCIYVLNVDDDLLVKRVRRRLDATVEIVSDNAIYPPETIRAEQLRSLRVVGRVVYFCRTP